MNEIIFALIIFALLGYVIYLNKLHQKETQVLLDRIMARSLEDFQTVSRPPMKDSPVKLPSDVGDMSEMNDEEWDKVIQKQAGTESTVSKAIQTLKSKIRI